MYQENPAVLNDSVLGRSNNFGLIRLIAAIVFAITHMSWVIYGYNLPDRPDLNLIKQICSCAVCVFFSMSGFLISSSLVERGDIVRFTVARFLRLCPLLFICSVLIAFVVGPLVSELRLIDYFVDWHVWVYVPVTTLLYPDMTLPGVFTTVPDPHEINVSIWTLRYEAIAYFLIAVVASFGYLNRQYFGYVASAVLVAYLLISYGTSLRDTIPFFKHGFTFGMAFLIGAMLYIYREAMEFQSGGVLVVVGLALLTNNLIIMEPFRILAIGYTTVWLGLNHARILTFFRSKSDYSYGLFVFHWPIAQTVVWMYPGISYIMTVWIALPLALFFAIISWHIVEAPLIALGSKLTSYLKQTNICCSWMHRKRYSQS